MAEKKWVNLSVMGYGDIAVVAETNATSIVADTVNRLGLCGDDWKPIFARHYTGGEQKQFLIHFMVYTDKEIDRSSFFNVPGKVPA